MSLNLLKQLIPQSDLNTYLVSKEILSYSRPLHLDLGCGNATFIQERSKLYPDHFFVGIDRSKKRILKSVRRLAREKITNIQLIEGDITEILTSRVEDDSVHSVYINFPDPWPKRRHHKNRLVNDEFIDLMARKLMVNGTFFASSDHQDYFLLIHQKAHFHPKLKNQLDLPYLNFMEGYQNTLFEQKWKQENRCLYYMKMAKIH